MPELIVKEREISGVTVLDLEGKITIGEGTTTLRAATRRLINTNIKRIVLNMEAVSYSDSSSVGEFVSTFSMAQKEECIVVFAKPQPKIVEFWIAIKLISVFVIFPSVEEAVEAIKELSFSEFILKYSKPSS